MINVHVFFILVDLTVVISANLINMLLAVMFLLRARQSTREAQIAGWCAVGFALPLAAVAVMNYMG